MSIEQKMTRLENRMAGRRGYITHDHLGDYEGFDDTQSSLNYNDKKQKINVACGQKETVKSEDSSKGINE